MRPGSRHGERLRDLVRRFVRTPSFLVRYFSIEDKSLDATAVRAAFAHCDLSGVSLAQMLGSFLNFLNGNAVRVSASRCFGPLIACRQGHHHRLEVWDEELNPEVGEEFGVSAQE